MRHAVFSRLAALALGLLVVVGCSGDGDGVRDEGGGRVAGSSTSVGTEARPERRSEPRSTDPSTASSTKASVAEPVHVAIPSIGVSSDLMKLGLNADQTVEVPPAEKGMTAGWYTGGAVPGQRGPGVVIGHNDTKYGPAVFHDLKKLAKGAKIEVRDARGTTRTFTVTGTETVKKTAFPTQRVYGPTSGPELRLVTCDGEFDAEGHPVDNLIVYATL
ncbi:class F sortase [Streptomyces sp. NPDC047315]|uniref:class F sortase n=1 Tax=Streptomyces sp. NPDC047315 TaxID=3155142 RepID=UPI0033F9F88D